MRVGTSAGWRYVFQSGLVAGMCAGLCAVVAMADVAKGEAAGQVEGFTPACIASPVQERQDLGVLLLSTRCVKNAESKVWHCVETQNEAGTSIDCREQRVDGANGIQVTIRNGTRNRIGPILCNYACGAP